jgi:hypothetical protein
VDAEDDARFDAEKLDVLRRWGRGLNEDGRDEVRAAGRAITMLIEEIERLYVELWHARDALLPPAEGPARDEQPSGETIETTLMARLRERLVPRRLGRRWTPSD